MESEKVKEIKEALELHKRYAMIYLSKSGEAKIFTITDILTLIKELESENERLEKELKQVVLCNKGLQDGINEYQADNKEMGKSNQELKDRIAELEKERVLCDGTNLEETEENNILEMFCKECKNKVLKQFAERLKEVSNYTDEHGYFVVNFDDIDETLKEMIEDDK